MKRRAVPTTTLLAVLIAAAVLSVWTAGAASPLARAEDRQQDPVSVVLTGVAPVALGDSTTLSVSGRVANSGFDDLSVVSVRLTLSASPLAERRLIRQASRGEPAPDAVPLYFTDTPIADVLSPGAQQDFRISVRTADIPLPSAGVYVVGVEVVGYGSAGYVILGSAQTRRPYVPTVLAPINVAWLWPLATWPGQDADGVLLGDYVPREIANGGRLRELLDVGATSPAVSWVVDPQLLQLTSDMADGYLVQKGGEIRPGTGQEAAAAWQADAERILGVGRKPRERQPAQPAPLLSLPYADIDADAVTRAGLASDVVRAVTTTPELMSKYLQRDPDGTVAWAPGGRIDPSTLELLASSGVRSIVVRERAVPLVTDPGYTPTGHTDLDTTAGPVRALIIDAGLLDALTMPQGNQSQILAARQRFIAELAFVALDSGPAGRTLVAAAGSTRWDPNPRLLRALLASLRSTDWTRLVPVENLLAQPATEEARTLAAYDAAARGHELEAAYMDRVATAQTSLDSLRQVVANALPITTPAMAALLRSESTAWRTRPETGVALVEQTQASIDKQMTRLYVVPRESVTFSGDRGSVPVTVANDFDQPVIIGVELTGSPAARLTADPVEPITIEPGKRASLEVPVRIVGGDALPVTVQLIDDKGRAFGVPVSMELRTTAYSRAALWVAIGAAVLLLVFVVFDIVRRARQRGANRQPTPEGTT